MFIYLHWFYRIAAAFSKALPANMLAMVVLGLFSRVASILALLLPVKILLLVGNNRVPAYFPTFLQEIQLDTLISLLCGATISLYASYVGLEKLISGIERKAERLLVSQLAPIACDSRSIRALRKAYSRVSGNLTELCFLFAVLLFISLAYTALFVTIIMYSSVVLVAYELFVSTVQRIDEDDEESVEKGSLINLWVDIGFLVSFFFIILGMLIDQGPGIIVAFTCFLLLRRASGGMKRFIRNLMIVFAQQPMLSLVLSGSVSVGESGEVDSDEVLTKSNIDSIISVALRETFPSYEVNIVSTARFDQGDDMTYAYLVDATVSGSQDRFLVKLFPNNRQRVQVECELYSAISDLSVNGVVNHGNHQRAGWLLANFSFDHSRDATETGMAVES